MDIKDLTPELKEKAQNCKSVDEIIALAKEEGVDLSDEQLDAIAGGTEWIDCFGL